MVNGRKEDRPMDEQHNGSGETNGHDPAGTEASASGGGAADETFAWTAPDDAEPAASGDARAAAERMLGQLQSMIDNVATQAAPVVRQIGAKAAELAAVAADRAGPLAHKAAEATADASEKLAVRSRTWAADLRSKVADSNGAGDADSASGTTTAVIGADDPIEEAARDEPAEGARD
jgi:hypothetical protein